MVSDHVAAAFGSTAAIPIAGTAFAHLGTALPRREGTRLGAAAFFTANVGTWRLRTVAFFAAGARAGQLCASVFLTASFGAGRLFKAAIFAAGLGIWTWRLFRFTARLVLRLGIRGTRETQGGEHGQ